MSTYEEVLRTLRDVEAIMDVREGLDLSPNAFQWKRVVLVNPSKRVIQDPEIRRILTRISQAGRMVAIQLVIDSTLRPDVQDSLDMFNIRR